MPAENMNAIAQNDCSDARWSRFPFWTIVQGLLTLAVLTTQQAQAAVECEAFQWEPERLDFNRRERPEKDPSGRDPPF